MTPAESREAALLRLRVAMNHVEEAQRELGRACADLSSIVGGARSWERLKKLYDRVHAEWYRLNDVFVAPPRRFEMDGMNQHPCPTGHGCDRALGAQLHGVAALRAALRKDGAE